ncbi:BCCT family transporter [Clavibacter michiganensis]|uniref:Glycine betaine transporter BetP n=1 Tax=Clavibacter michiganensis subsp. michiganensis TaxID=33013 RepID=A0A251XFW6_CLAMM|nr:BCCT family transporter [Clavibacter michiganensis]OUE01449.1 Glycine betaine transporter BetP [Clavibacter michiganensis subsp. michiganensis]
MTSTRTSAERLLDRLVPKRRSGPDGTRPPRRDHSDHRLLEARFTGSVDLYEPEHPKIDRLVFGVTAVLAVGFVVWGIVSTDGLATITGTAQSWVINQTGWLFVLAASFFVIFVIWLAASRYGRIKLGADDEKPQFKTVSWIAMMFSAGMGIGLMFFGAAEPLSFFVTPPPGTTQPESEAAIRTAMATAMFHWGLHPWAIYAVAGIAIGYGTFRKGRKQLFSSIFQPLLGTKRTEGWAGRVIDMLAIFATLFGSAASLGIGATQIGAGLEFNGWVDEATAPLLIGIIVVLTIAFIFSAVSGIARGIQWLSNINMVLAVVLAVFVFVVGPTLLILNLIPATLGAYLGDMTEMASRTAATGGDEMSAWLSSWTVFYWAWWISWTPFVGMFIARISRGRTIREFVVGVLLAPSIVALIWFSIFGGSAIQAQQTDGDMTVDGAVVSDNTLFQLLNHYPLASISTVLVMLLVAIFFVSGADSASIVMGTLSQRGALHPSRKVVVFWGVVMGAVAAIMLAIGGGGTEALTGLQNLTVVASLPFVIVMLVACYALWKELRTDPLIVRRQVAVEMMRDAVVNGVEQHGDHFQLSVDPVEPDEAEVREPLGDEDEARRS